MERLFDDAIGQVRDLVSFANLLLFEADVLASQMHEETDPFAEEHWYHIHLDFIEQAGHEKLLWTLALMRAISLSLARPSLWPAHWQCRRSRR